MSNEKRICKAYEFPYRDPFEYPNPLMCTCDREKREKCLQEYLEEEDNTDPNLYQEEHE